MSASKGIIKCICEQIPNKGLSAGNVSTRYVEELIRVRKFNSFGKIQVGHAHFRPWEFFVKNWKSLYINNHDMWVLYTHVFWHEKSIYTISFTLRQSPDPFLTIPMPDAIPWDFFAKNSKFSYINNHNMWVLYSHVSWHENRFALLALHSDHRITWPNSDHTHAKFLI